MNQDELRQKVLDFIKKRPGADALDIAGALDLGLIEVGHVCHDLLIRGDLEARDEHGRNLAEQETDYEIDTSSGPVDLTLPRLFKEATVRKAGSTSVHPVNVHIGDTVVVLDGSDPSSDCLTIKNYDGGYVVITAGTRYMFVPKAPDSQVDMDESR